MKKWIVVANENQGKIFQKKNGFLSYVCSISRQDGFIQDMATFLNKHEHRFDFLTLIFPKDRISLLVQALKSNVRIKTTEKHDDFFS